MTNEWRAAFSKARPEQSSASKEQWSSSRTHPLFLCTIHVKYHLFFLAPYEYRSRQRKFQRLLSIRCLNLLLSGWVPLKQISRQNFEDEKFFGRWFWKAQQGSGEVSMGENVSSTCVLPSQALLWVSEGDSNTLGVGAYRQVSESFHQRSKGTWVLIHPLPFRVMTATRERCRVENKIPATSSLFCTAHRWSSHQWLEKVLSQNVRVLEMETKGQCVVEWSLSKVVWAVYQ